MRWFKRQLLTTRPLIAQVGDIVLFPNGSAYRVTGDALKQLKVIKLGDK